MPTNTCSLFLPVTQNYSTQLTTQKLKQSYLPSIIKPNPMKYINTNIYNKIYTIYTVILSLYIYESSLKSSFSLFPSLFSSLVVNRTNEKKTHTFLFRVSTYLLLWFFFCHCHISSTSIKIKIDCNLWTSWFTRCVHVKSKLIQLCVFFGVSLSNVHLFVKTKHKYMHTILYEMRITRRI